MGPVCGRSVASVPACAAHCCASRATCNAPPSQPCFPPPHPSCSLSLHALPKRVINVTSFSDTWEGAVCVVAWRAGACVCVWLRPQNARNLASACRLAVTHLQRSQLAAPVDMVCAFLARWTQRCLRCNWDGRNTIKSGQHLFLVCVLAEHILGHIVGPLRYPFRISFCHPNKCFPARLKVVSLGPPRWQRV